jgi:phage terminase large subunit-like protein
MVTVGRQSGKSWLSRAVCLWRLHHAELFGEEQTILHVANRRSTAMEVMRPAGLWAAQRYGERSVKWGNMESGIYLPSGDRWLIHAANESAGVGYSVSMVFVDEAWKVKREVVDDALAPTMSERMNPQLWLVSTAGDSTSDLMTTYRTRAIDQMEDPGPGAILILEWSAPADANPDDLETWKWASPEWSERREKFLHQQWSNIEESAWRREWLNQWVTKADHWLKDSIWKETTSDEFLPLDATWTVALETDFDGMGHAVAVAAPSKDGHIITRVTTHRTIAEADERIAKIREENPRLQVIATPGYTSRLRAPIDHLVGNREAAAATQNLLDLFDRRAIKHDGSQILREHLSATTVSKRQGGWVITAPMGRGGVYAARAVMFATWQASKIPSPAPMIKSRRRA